MQRRTHRFAPDRPGAPTITGRLRRRWWPAALGAVSALLLAPSARGACDLQQLEIPVRIIDHRPVATLTLNGTEVPMLVDSGAFFSMLSASTATQLQLPTRRLPWGLRIQGYTGQVAAQMTQVERVGLRGAQLRQVDFIVGGNELGAGIMGVLGRNILSIGDTEYDLAHGLVRLSLPKGDCATTNFAHWAGDAPVVVVPLAGQTDDDDTAIRVEVRINGQRTLAMLDTGAPHTALTLPAARRAGIRETDLVPSGRVGGAGEGQVRAWTGHVASFELGGERVADSHLGIDDTDDHHQGVLMGLDYFLSHRIYVSRLQRQVYVTWNGSPVFARNRLADSPDNNRFAARPQEVAPDNADALARRGAAALAAGAHQRALDDLNRACTLAPEVADHVYTRARVHLAMQAPGPALADLDRALALDPTLATARHRRARLQAALDRAPDALRDLAQLDATLPPSHDLRADMGALYVELDQTSPALRQFDLWVGSHPKDARLPSVLNERCWLRARRNLDLPLALQDCLAAVDLDDGVAAYHDSLGWAQLRLGDAAKARRAFDKALQLEAKAFSLYGRGLAKLRLNDPQGAAQDLAAARQRQASIDQDARQAGFEFADAAARTPAPGS